MPNPTTPKAQGCVCTVDDGLVQEWVSKARVVARGKGFNPSRQPSVTPDALVTRLAQGVVDSANITTNQDGHRYLRTTVDTSALLQLAEALAALQATTHEEKE